MVNSPVRRMRFGPKFVFLLCCLVSPLQANQDGVVVRSSPVYAGASSSAQRVGQIDAGTRVSVFSRQGGWKEVFAEEKAIIGWVRSYQVREGNYAAAQIDSQPDSRGFLSGLASFSRRASRFFSSAGDRTSSGTATIGVRGLSEAEINSAVADFEQLEKMKGFASNPHRVASFASRGGLRARRVGHIAGGN